MAADKSVEERSRENYQPTFKFPYLPIFITDLFLRGYGEYNPIIIIKEKKWECLISREMLTKLANWGFENALQDGFYKEFEKKSSSMGKELLELKDTDLSSLNKEEFIDFLDKLSEVCKKSSGIYSKTEFIFFTKIEKKLNEYIKDKFSIQDVLSGKVDLSSWPEEEKKLAEYITRMQHLKLNLRKIINKVMMGKDSFLLKVIKQLAIRIKRKDASEMTINEAKKVLKGEAIGEVASRQLCSYITWDKKTKSPHIEDYEESCKKIKDLTQEIPQNEVKGIIACPGIARGRAKIIPLSMNPEKYLSKMEAGDILVSDTTGPELIFAIEKAAAIVTDEGGMMSHAATIAREFNIPCVVGTKYSTKVFKDGDYIEVDADKGIVKKLN